MKTETSKRLKIHKTISTIITAIGIILILFMIIVEGELGALPLLLLIGGSIWLLITNYLIKTRIPKKD
jgi:hypothetical protein